MLLVNLLFKNEKSTLNKVDLAVGVGIEDISV